MADASYDNLMRELLQMFAVEAAEHLQTLSRTLLKLEQAPTGDGQKDLLNAAFRAAHSLKGSARAVELHDIERIAHETEAVLSAARSGKLVFNAEVVDGLLAATDAIQALVEGQTPADLNALQSRLKNLAEGKTAETSPPLPSPPPAKPAPHEGVDALMRELLQMFAVEAAEHLQVLSQSLLKLERQPPEAERVELVNAAFRAAHSLKGSARAVELGPIEGIAHEAENILSAVRSGKMAITPEAVDILLEATDAIQTLLGGQVYTSAQQESLKGRLKAVAEQKNPPRLEMPSLPPPEPLTAPQARKSGAIAQWQAEIEKKEGAKRPSVKPSPLSTGASEETIRVSVEKLDDLMAQAGELIVSKISSDERLRELREIRNLMARWEKAWSETNDLRRRIEGYIRDEKNADWEEVQTFLSETRGHISLAVEQLRTLDKTMTSDNMRMTLVTQSIQEEIRRVRMLPVETLRPTLERVVRDVARAVNKKAQLVVRGADVELDKKVLEDLKDPLVHLLRNSVDHGIETPDVRIQNQKMETGLVTVAVSQRGGNVHIIVSDDGRGLDAEAIRRSSVEKGLVPAHEAENMSDEEVYLLIFQAGLSTKREVTAVSGRGVGMDVVKSQLESLQGRISVKSVRGQGTEFHLIVPISLATIRGLMVRVGLEQYALPLHTVEKIITIRPKQIYTIEGNKMFDLDKEPMAVMHLADVLERPRDPDRDDRLLAIIVAGAEKRMAFLVDDFLSEQEMVVKPLGKQLKRVRNVAGATLLGTGQPIIILNVADLIKSAQGGRVSHRPIFVQRADPETSQKAPSKILVVDDSITTRTLERNILQSAGYNVTTAVDGVEALALLEGEKFDLVVSDVEMPRINGFELVEWIRQSPSYGQIPVILVTSLESQEHREQGARVGADAYIVKSGFEQTVLLETISRFIET